jgi:S-adenosylmethionine synthetase
MTGGKYAAEFVLPGHPDKLCDAIVDALVERAGRQEKRALCGVEAGVHRSSVFVTGRMACRGSTRIDVKEIVRAVYASAGYDGDWRPGPDELTIHVDLCRGPLREGEDDFRRVADDQSIVTTPWTCRVRTISHPSTGLSTGWHRGWRSFASRGRS